MKANNMDQGDYISIANKRTYQDNSYSAGGWQPDLDADYGVPITSYPVSPSYPKQATVEQETLKAQPLVSAYKSYPLEQHSIADRPLVGSQPLRGTRSRAAVRWVALFGLSLMASTAAFGNIGGWLCIGIWLAVLLIRKYLGRLEGCYEMNVETATVSHFSNPHTAKTVL